MENDSLRGHYIANCKVQGEIFYKCKFNLVGYVVLDKQEARIMSKSRYDAKYSTTSLACCINLLCSNNGLEKCLICQVGFLKISILLFRSSQNDEFFSFCLHYFNNEI